MRSNEISFIQAALLTGHITRSLLRFLRQLHAFKVSTTAPSSPSPVTRVGVETKDGPQQHFILGRISPQFALGHFVSFPVRTRFEEQFRDFGPFPLVRDVGVPSGHAIVRG